MNASQKSTWDPEVYARFRDERSAPFYDLMEGVRKGADMRVLDLGCGTGELTQLLHRRLGACETLGIDSSETMLAKSWAYAGDGLRFERADINDISPGVYYDLVFSNAALQWVPAHPQLLRRLGDMLTHGGQLAVQMPANHDHPAHLCATELAQEPPFSTALAGARRTRVLPPWEYATVLHHLGFREQRVEVRVYDHLLRDRGEVLAWMKGTMLTFYRHHLPPDLYEQFLGRYQRMLESRLDDERPYFFPYQRLFIWATR